MSVARLDSVVLVSELASFGMNRIVLVEDSLRSREYSSPLDVSQRCEDDDEEAIVVFLELDDEEAIVVFLELDDDEEGTGVLDRITGRAGRFEAKDSSPDAT